MEFVDKTGHKFFIQSYSNEPLGYEYDVMPYIFWLDSEYTHQLSTDNYYILPIRMVIPKGSKKLKIKIHDSKVFSLLSSKRMHELVDNIGSLNDYLHLDENEFVTELKSDDLIYIETKDNYIVPFYLVGYSENEDTFVTNGLIYYQDNSGDDIWTPVSFGGIFYGECEELIINGHNMGVNLPKDILGALYQYSYYSEVPDETLYANKIKEYLINLMHLKGQIGNFNSVIESLGWFGYGDKLEIQKLLQIDNEFQEHFFLDDFNINNNLLHSYATFRNSTYITLRLWDNQETDKIEHQKYSIEDFWGEGKPILENLFNKTIIKHYDEGDIDFYRSYYDYCFDELGLKLAMLDYYFKKYFLPIHLHIHNTYIAHHVFTNDIKMLNETNDYLADPYIELGADSVKFQDTKFYYIYNQTFYTDTNFNNFVEISKNINDEIVVESYYKKIGNEVDENILYINKPCINIPIEIQGNGYFNCHLILLKNENVAFESDFQIYQTNKLRYSSFVLLPKYINKELNDEIYWLEANYRLALLVNDRWYYHDFNIKCPEFQLNIGTLEYKYYTGIDNPTKIDLNDPNFNLSDKKLNWGYEYDRNQLKDGLEDLSDEELEKLYKENNVDIRYWLDETESLHKQLNRLSEKDNIIDFNSFMYVPSLVEVNDINFYDKLNNTADSVYDSEKSQSMRKMSSGILTKNKINDKIKQNTNISHISNNGVIFNPNKLLNIGDTIIPQFYFNDYTRDISGNLIDERYKIEKFSVDILFGSFNRGNKQVPFAKKTLNLIEDSKYNDSLFKDNDPNTGIINPVYIKLSDWDIAFGGPDKNYEILQDLYKEELQDAENPFETELPFKINQCVIQSLSSLNDIFRMRFVWNIKLTCETSESSSYDKSGNPLNGYYQDIDLRFAFVDKCTQENCPLLKWRSEGYELQNPDGTKEEIQCKFRTYLDNIENKYEDYDKINKDHLQSTDIEDEAKILMENILNQTINKAKDTIIIHNNDRFLNRIHIYNLYHCGYKGKFDIFKNKDIYEDDFKNPETDLMYFGSENSIFGTQSPSDIVPLKYDKKKYGEFGIDIDKNYNESLIKLYKIFFSEPNGEQLFMWPTKGSNYDYDFYLMHDNNNWYVVFISQMPIYYANPADLIGPDELEFIDSRGHKFLMKKYRSGNNFLVNRMYFESSNGHNIFSKNKLITATIDNVKFPFILEHGPKWEITPYSLGIDSDITTSVSNGNTCIFSIGKKNQNYVKGYYDINVRYSIDGETQHQQKKQARICISD